MEARGEVTARALRSAGMVLAAGASERMGSPKALLKTPQGMPLALHQAAALTRSGCDPVVIVLGADAPTIRAELQGAPIVVNEDWRAGRSSSVLAGLRALPQAEGYLILPVDTVGVRPDTLAHVLQLAETTQVAALRPTFHEQPGHLVWISRRVADRLLQDPPPGDAPLRERLDPLSMRFDMDDPAILRNINTPEAWREVMEDLVR